MTTPRFLLLYTRQPLRLHLTHLMIIHLASRNMVLDLLLEPAPVSLLQMDLCLES